VRAASHATRIAFGAAVAAGLGVVGATIWIGSLVSEETVVAAPYEEGLRHDAERRARAALGWEVRGFLPPAAPGKASLAFEIVDAAGRPVGGAAVEVLVARPDTGRDAAVFAAQAAGPGRFEAEVAVPSPGPWRLTFDVRRGGDRVRIERAVTVAAPCDAGRDPCARALPGGGEVTLEMGPRPLRTMREIEVRVEVRPAPAQPPPLGAREGPPSPPSLPLRGGEGRGEGGEPARRVTVSFSMPGMDMGENRVVLAPGGQGRYAGRAVLVRCPAGRTDWIAEVEVASPGASARTVRFDLTVER
jgi:nitrogen fixation protein FixH